MFRVFADHPHYAFAVDDLAFIANLFYRCSDLHAVFPSNSSAPMLLIPLLVPLLPNLVIL